MIKRGIRAVLSKFGYEIIKKKKIDDFELYKHLFNEDILKKKSFYNIGAGSFTHPYWTNIDKKSDWYSKSQENNDGIDFDLLSLKKIPIEEKTAEIIYSSHVVEHITDEAAQNLFNESFRILKENGVFRITMPDIDLDYIALQNNDFNHYYWFKKKNNPKISHQKIKTTISKDQASIQQIFLFQFTTQISELYDNEKTQKISDNELMKLFKKNTFEDALDYCTSKCNVNIQKENPGHHINWWNEKKTIKMLKRAGFGKIYRSGYGQSLSPVLRNINIFDNTRPKNSLYIEAVK